MVQILKNKKWGVVILTTIAFVALSFIYEMDYWLMQKPKSVHVWRQCDGASYALNYFQNNRPFFKPQVHHRLAQDGETCSEFPIIYYAASKLYAAFGYYDYYIRWMGYLMFYASLIALSLTSLFFIRSIFLALTPALLWMTSCLSMYYAGNFLPDMPALSCAIIGFYFFIRFSETNIFASFIWAIFFSMMAALLKVSSALLFVVIVLYMLYQQFFRKNKGYGLKHYVVAMVGIVIVLAWIFYAKWYNVQGGYPGNLMGTLGIWILDDQQRINYTYWRTLHEWFPAIQSPAVWVAMAMGAIGAAFFYKKIDVRLRFSIFLLVPAVIFYYYAWFAVFDNHDYYLINTLCLPIIVSLAVAQLLDKIAHQKIRISFMLAFAVLLVINIAHGRDQMQFRRHDPNWNLHPAKGFYTITSYLRDIGIDRNQKVFVMPDGSANIPLYLMNNPGFTTFAGNTPASVIDSGTHYMLISDTAVFQREDVKEYIHDTIGFYEGIYIFKL